MDREPPRTRKSEPRWWWMSHVSPSRLGQPGRHNVSTPGQCQPRWCWRVHVSTSRSASQAPGRKRLGDPTSRRADSRKKRPPKGQWSSVPTYHSQVTYWSVGAHHQQRTSGSGGGGLASRVCNLREHNLRMNVGASTQTVLSSILGVKTCVYTLCHLCNYWMMQKKEEWKMFWLHGNFSSRVTSNLVRHAAQL